MKSKTTSSKKSVSQTTAKKRSRKIYLNDVAWYYEDDPFDKQKTVEAVELLRKLDFSTLLESDRKAEEQSEQGTAPTE
ncbi:hypothetical protein [Chryseolinea soli]|uniref:Uncharacterized protein n=1 Tax=Chryseolinea soli TaxID=2321403 RepID=A0A385SQR4_9BACT|nr:hypothetical protein [Chryseolinea soli]AYB33324.1 hypothetical protein D4L85_23255 [Chryseolinea soli]